MLAAHWKLPGDLVEAIRWHHAPQDAPAAMADEVRRATILVHVANQLAKYCYVYGEDMEIDIVGDDLLKQAGLPGPLTRLLNQRVRGAISRAIFFADESGGGEGVGAVRRFLRLEKSRQPGSASDEVVTRGRGDDVRIGWLEEDWWERFFAAAVTVDCSSPAMARVDGALRCSGKGARFTSRCTAAGVERLLTLALAHQGTLGLEERTALPARFVLRRILSNLTEIAESAEVEVWQAAREGALVTAVVSPGLAFSHRLGEGVEGRSGRRVLNTELANVLNLRWFTRVLTTREGGALVFVTAAG
jgi:hypothetical protein